jgi:multiple sugar transport system ATP-binding protein
MVFENYALYPHITAYDNIAFPLRSPKHRMAEEKIKETITKIAAMLNISELLDRLPSQVSNGQRQRIALGRALVRSPRVFLMDEPLVHLDAKLRNAMRKELKSIQDNLNATTVYVTHDYAEALSLGDRIAVINEGAIQQIGTPDEIFYTPASRFVAKLFGEPEINIFEVEVCVENDSYFVRLPWQGKKSRICGKVGHRLAEVGGKIEAGLRGMNILYDFSHSTESIQAAVYNIEPMGNRNCITAALDGGNLQFMVPAEIKPEIDSNIYLTCNMEQAIYFHQDTGKFLCRSYASQTQRGEIVGQY